MKKQTIMYNNKKMKLPYTLTAGETSTEMVTRQNPFSGQSIELPEFAAVVYDKTIELNLAAERKDAATGQPPVSGIVMESPIIGRGVRSTLLVDVKGSEVGFFDEIGSIYTKEILKVFRDENWLPVEHAD